MQKRGKINQAVIPLIIGFSLILVSLMFASPSFTGNAIFNPAMPASCSNENIKTLWDSIFQESSTGIIVRSNNTHYMAGLSQPNICGNYIAYKIIGTEVYGLYGEEFKNYSFQFIQPGFPQQEAINESYILAFHGNFSTEYIARLITPSNLTNGVYDLFILMGSTTPDIPAPRRNISINSPENEFSSKFKISHEASWKSNSNGDFTSYTFNENETSINSIKIFTGVINANYTHEYIIFQKVGIAGLQNCTSNWTAITTNCSSDERNIIYYTDLNNCANSTRPANLTSFCDYDRNGIIGSLTAYQDTNFDLTLTIDGAAPNSTLIYNSTKLIEFKEGNITRVKFNYDFSTPFIPSNISIKKQPSSFNYGYMIVQGISTTKTLTIDKLSSSTNKICAVNREILDIDNVSTNCNENSEYLLDCPGNNSFITCNVSEGKYVVSGLTKSAVKEIITSTAPVCSANWTCASWSACTAAQQIRTCSDSNNCNVTTGKPLETQACACVPKWTCSVWAPEVCSSNRTQTRSCTDSNNCNTNEGKERFPEKQSCAYNPEIDSKVIILAAVIILGLLATIVIVYLIMKNLHSHQSQQENIIIAKPQTPPMQMPINPYQMQKPAVQQQILPTPGPEQPSLPEEQPSSENKDNTTAP